MNESAQIIDLRLIKLHETINDIFLSENPWARLQLPANFETARTEMIEVVKVRKSDVTVMEVFGFEEFRPLIFPQEVHFHLKKGDTFLASFGLKNGKWYVFELSPPYEDGDSGECEWGECDALELDDDLI